MAGWYCAGSGGQIGPLSSPSSGTETCGQISSVIINALDIYAHADRVYHAVKAIHRRFILSYFPALPRDPPALTLLRIFIADETRRHCMGLALKGLARASIWLLCAEAMNTRWPTDLLCIADCVILFYSTRHTLP